MAAQKQKVNAPSKEVTFANVWENVKDTRSRQRVGLAHEANDIGIAINCYAPGARNEMHYHVGTGQSFLVLKGPCVIRHRHKDLPPEDTIETTMQEGDCVLIPANVYYQLHNPGPDHQVVLYQVKQPGELIAVEGKGVMNNKDYFTQKREDSHDLKKFAEEVPSLSK